MWKMKWMMSVLFSAHLWRGSHKLLKNPLRFYIQLLEKLVDDRPRLVRLFFKSGKVFYAYRFMDLFKFYEIFIEDVYKTESDNLNLVVDIGGNKGYFSLHVADRSPKASFHCYEPEPNNFKNLTRQLEDNNLKFTAHQEGVGAKNGMLKLFVHPKNDGGHSLFESSVNNEYVMVKISGLDKVMSRLPNDATIDLLKLDCEGAERDIILSMTEAHARRIREIFYEPTHKLYSPSVLNNHLKKLGFKIFMEKGIIKACRKPDPIVA